MTAYPSSIAYLNGSFLPLPEAKISPLDRGFLFADGIYEVVPAYDGRLFRLAEHLTRLENGLAGIRLHTELQRSDWEALLAELVARNGHGDLAVYLQVTRGAPEVREHTFPNGVEPTVFAMASPLKPMPESVHREGLAAITGADIRWGACHLKTVALLANVLARQQSLERGAAETLLIRDGYLTEGSSTNVFLVQDGTVFTPLKDHRILPGITRDLILELAASDGIPCRERDLSASVLETADEVWLTSSSKEVVPVTTVDGRRVGEGVPGPLWRRMMALFQAYKREVRAATARGT